MSKHPPYLTEDHFVPIGKVLSPWGVRGEVKFLLYNLESEVFVKTRKVYIKTSLLFEPLSLVSVRRQGKFLVIHFQGYHSPEKVFRLKGEELFIPKEELPARKKGEIYVFEFVGLTVLSTQGEKIGIVKRVENYGASEILVVEKEMPENKSSEVLIPMISDIVKEVSLSEKKIVVDLLEGLI